MFINLKIAGNTKFFMIIMSILTIFEISLLRNQYPYSAVNANINGQVKIKIIQC